MFRQSFAKITFIVAIGLCATATFAKNDHEMTPPRPLENKVFNSMVGSWEGESNMMGTPMRETMKISWSTNHQFIMLELHAKGIKDPSIQYEGVGMFGVVDNKAKTWWFDSWGAKSVTTGTGSFTDNAVELTDSNDNFKETRSFTVNGNEMKMAAKGTMMMNGKEMPFDQTVTYQKRK